MTEKLNTGAILRKYGFHTKKALGQNFLTDATVVSDIIEGAGMDASDHVIEIGPGVGTLTRALLEKAGKVTVIEIDESLIPILMLEFQGEDRLTIIHGDVLKQDLKEIAQHKPVKVVANLPYYVTTPILLNLLAEDFPWISLTIMIQKEVAERLMANPNTKAYGSLSLLVAYYATVEEIRVVKPESFLPSPKVDSMVIRLDRRKEKAVAVEDEAFFLELIRTAFAMRRKTLNNNLKALGLTPDQLNRAFEQAEILPNRRAESLTIQDFARLSDALCEVKK